MKKVFLRHKLLAVILFLLFFLGSYAFWWEPSSLQFRQEILELEAWNLPPLKIAILTDLHIGSPYQDLEKLKLIVNKTNDKIPDLIVLLGDYGVDGVVGGHYISPEAIAQELAQLSAPLGVHAVLGNHDWWMDGPRFRKALKGVSIQVLEDEAAPISFQGKNFWLVGVSDFFTRPHDVRKALSGVQESDPILAITHNPDVFPEIPSRVALTLAGHTHGGQVDFPWLGTPIVPSKYGSRYVKGLIIEEGKPLLVSSGTGTSIIPVRFRVPPEVVLLTIK